VSFVDDSSGRGERERRTSRTMFASSSQAFMTFVDDPV